MGDETGLPYDIKREIERNQELLEAYRSIPTGTFGAIVIEGKIKRAFSALISQDAVEMIAAYQELKKSE